MRRKTTALITALVLSMSLSACGKDTFTTSDSSDAERIEELERELEELKAENEELKAQSENGETENQDISESNRQADNQTESLLKATIEAPETSGVCGANLTWYYQNGVLAITGTGEMTDYSSYKDTPWYDIKDKIGWIIIDDGATTVGKETFCDFKELSKVVLPDTVTSIGKYAFSGCSNIGEIELPSSLTSIGSEAFSGCSNIKEITFPSSLTSIGSCAFSGCSNIKEITFPSSLTSIGSYAFSGCDNLTEISYNGQSYTREEFKKLIIESGIMMGEWADVGVPEE